MPKPLGISLGIDFARIDRDLASVADRIERVGKTARIEIGGGDGGDVAASIGNLGERLSAGIAGGVRSASGLMLGFAAHVDGVLNRVAGATITLFRRVDAAMKFPIFDAFFRSAGMKLANFAAFWRKPLSDLDLAIGGAFGKVPGAIARIVKVAIDQLVASIGGALREAMASVVAEVGKLAGGFSRAEASAAALMATVDKTAAKADRFPMGGKGLRSTVPGPRIGTGTDFTAPVAAAEAPARKLSDALKGVGMLAREAGSDLMLMGRLGLSAGAGLLSVPIRLVGAWRRFHNFLSSLGDVAGKTFDQIFRGALRIGTLGVFGRATGDAAKFGAAAGTARTSVNQLSGAVVSLGRNLLVAFGVVGVLYKTVQFFKDAIQGAAGLESAVTSAKVTFGSSFDVVNRQVDDLAKRFWISRRAQLAVADEFGAIAQGAGLSESASAKFANSLTRTAAEVAALRGMDFKEVGDAISSGLAGRGMELKRLGVLLDEDTVKSYALARGAMASGGALSKQAEVAARAELILRGLSYAQGTLQRTSGEASKQFRLAGGGIEEFATRIGEMLLPAVKLATEAFNDLLASVLDLFDRNRDKVTEWAKAISDAMGTVGVVVRNLESVWKIAQLNAGAFVLNTIAYVRTMPENFGRVWEWLRRNWRALLQDWFNAMKAFWTNLFANLANVGKAIWDVLWGNGDATFVWKPLLDGFEATVEKLPEMVQPALVDVTDEINKITDEMAKKEAAVLAAGKGMAAAPKKPGPLGEATKTPDYKLASAVEINSKEAASIIARGEAGGGSRSQVGLLGQGVRLAQEQNQHLKKIADNTGKQGQKIEAK